MNGSRGMISIVKQSGLIVERVSFSVRRLSRITLLEMPPPIR
jgi:hypothetical protein